MNRRIPRDSSRRIRALIPYVLMVLIAVLVGGLWNKHYVVPHDRMIWCGLEHPRAREKLACQDLVYADWPLGQYLSGGVSPSEAARGPSIRAGRVSTP